MERERWEQVERIFHAALQAEESRRGELVRQSCAGDDDLRREVESLLAHHQNAGDFIETPAFEGEASTAGTRAIPAAANAKPDLKRLLERPVAPSKIRFSTRNR